jgi:hypothetical protein
MYKSPDFYFTFFSLLGTEKCQNHFIFEFKFVTSLFGQSSPVKKHWCEGGDEMMQDATY